MNKMISDLVQQALKEDIGSGDVSASLLKDESTTATIVTKESCVVCGLDYAHYAFLSLNEQVQINWLVSDGDSLQTGQTLCEINGRTRSMLSAERVALNFLQTLSGVATQTYQLVSMIADTNAKLLDTRKTLPGLRLAQKYAVTCGGGVNHRLGLYDCVMLKENHIIAAGSIKQAVALAFKQYPDLPLIVEVETLDQLTQSLTLDGITRVLCDNFSIQDLSRAVALAKDKLPIEASGNIDQTNILQVAKTGVDYISIGSITKNIKSIDLSLRFA